MSPDAAFTPFQPSALPGTPGQREDADERARAAGYAAGWVAGSRAAAESAVIQQRRFAEQHERREAERDAALSGGLVLLERATQAVATRGVPVLAEARRSLYEAALDLAAAVLQRELVPGPASAQALLERALALPADAPVHTIRLHPEDVAHVRALLDSRSTGLSGDIALVADPGLSRGDAISEHPTGQLDAQITTALARARRVLLEDET